MLQLQSWIGSFNPFTPKSDQCQISPAASPEILHYTVWRTWVFIALLRWKLIILPILATSLVHFSLKGWENVLFELGSGRVNITALSLRQGSKMSIFVFWIGSGFNHWVSQTPLPNSCPVENCNQHTVAALATQTFLVVTNFSNKTDFFCSQLRTPLHSDCSPCS